MRIIPLSEGAFSIDSTKVFVPFNKSADDLQQRPVGSLLVEIQPFAVITAQDIIILDTGLGLHTKDGALQIHQNLLNNGIDPEKVSKVLLSHLHKDHSGGIAIEDPASNEVSLTFPNAVYYVNAKELDFGLNIPSLSYKPEEFKILSSSENVVFLDDSGTIDGYIKYELTGAHSQFHTVFWIEENGEIVFFGGDVAPQLQQMKKRFAAKYDFDGKKSMELRTKWWEEAGKNHWTFLFYHGITDPTITL